MSTPILICDDSSLARKQIARSLPKDWDISVTFAENGEIGLDCIRQGKGDFVFLDLNMPVMDGYEVLEAIKKYDLPAIVIVISGDVQAEAHKRVRELGAIDFIEKPINNEKLLNILQRYGIYKPGAYSSLSATSPATAPITSSTPETASSVKVIEDIKQVDIIKTVQKANPIAEQNVNFRDALQEVSNIAMGRAGELLARLLDVFILLPIPNVNTLESSELNMALTHIAKNETVSAVSQGFMGSGINGEAIIIFHDANFNDIAKLLKYEKLIGSHIELEVMNDISNILIGAFLNGLAEQFDVRFSQGQPTLLGQHEKVQDLIKHQQKNPQQILTIEVNYGIQDHDIKCDLLLLFTEESISIMHNKIGYLLD